MAAPLFDFTDPDTANNVDDDISQIRDNQSVLYMMSVAASMGIPIMPASGQTITSSPAAKPTTVEFTGLPNSRKGKLLITYTGDNPTEVIVQLDSGGGGGYETMSTITLTFDGSSNWTGGTSA